MTIVNRTITYRGRIKVSSDDLRLAQLGKKCCTIRLGIASVVGERIDLTDGSEKISVRISKVDSTRRYESLNDLDASMEGFASTKELLEDLSKFYGRIDPSQPITIIYFDID
jgi:hypothetical protein